MYVSVTGLDVKAGQKLRFHWHSMRSMMQAKGAAGNRFADALERDGIYHTLTVWDEREAMRAYMKSGAHLAAMKQYGRIGHGKTIGYECDHVPGWAEALAKWDAEATSI